MTGDYVKLTAADLAHRWRERTLPEYVAEAVAAAGATEEYATPDSALRQLLVLAWYDLQEERGRAANGRWSIACDNLVCRIVGLTRLVGPVPWEEIDVDLILDGIYERIHAAIGTPTPLSDADRQQAQSVMDRRTVSTPGPGGT